ncbi:helix-turn-helix transcriptional regulator [Actinomyces radicidentis]|uniref:helix-turn-helix domain-containing protein n=1 Tax=Actinomyces radicidentis TaxID=111015 RepID=UPI0028E7F030|nr:helix-turn-helix transcriptional regulator [Actinomyces radicidentis]
MGNTVDIDDFERRAVARVWALADERGWSRRELAERSGMTRSRTQYVLAGERSCSMTAFERMCSALGVRPSAVIGEVEVDREREGLPPLWELAAQVIPGDDPEAEARSRVE